MIFLSKAPNLEIVTFADDILLMIQGPSHSAVLTTAVNTLQILEEWCKKHVLEISKGKTALMPVFIRNRDVYKKIPK